MILNYPKEDISKVMDILLKEYLPHRQPTLRRTSHESNPFKTLISCLLSLRTQDKNTEIASRNLFEHAKTPEDIIKIPIKKLEKLIFSSGHYKKKARVLKSVSRELIERFDRKVPNNKEDLLSIKGIGPKTANIVLAFAYGKEVLPIDTHCHRIPNRFGWIKTKNPVETEEDLEKILPRKYWREFNTVIILFGKNICQPISPFCSKCIIKQYCNKIGVIKSR
jgi:endonuclease-3